jgi:hypothetical protein
MEQGSTAQRQDFQPCFEVDQRQKKIVETGGW